MNRLEPAKRIGEETRGLFLAMLTPFYRVWKACISPLVGPACRFQPSCSDYFMEAVKIHGILKGIYLGLRRLLRCHALHPGGLDPVPPAR